MRITINSLRRQAARKRREPNFILSIKLKQWREAESMWALQQFPYKLLGVIQERMAPGWIKNSAHTI